MPIIPTTSRFRLASVSLALVAGATLSGTLACASGATPASSGAPEPATTVVVPPKANAQWPVKTREHVDLWLHGFALLQTDSTLVPFFRRGYRDDLTVLKNRANVTTQFDVNRDRLQSQMASNRLLVNAQFVPFYFASMEEMRTTIDRFVAAAGNVQSARSQQEAMQFGVLASYFQTATERSWLSLFASALWDEDAKFYHSYWTQQQRERANVIDSVQSMWQHTVRPRLQRVLNNTQQRDGDILLSLPLDGEGRSMSGSGGNQRNVVAVSFPARPADAPDAMYVIAHEIVGSITNTALADNTTPAEQRSGAVDRLASAAAVRGGLMLMEKLVPELADGYARYYVRATGRTLAANPRVQIAALFPLPDVIRDAIARQIDQVQGGI
ncbi:MAG: hypothetical protein ACR2MQ_10320 [Gemmatimonadaceae bacterium]